jgi:hypothetical protein
MIDRRFNGLKPNLSLFIYYYFSSDILAILIYT